MKKIFKLMTATAVALATFTACEDVPEVPFSEKKKVIMMAAYFNDNKAPDLLLKAWEKMAPLYPGWKIYMLGNGDVERYEHMARDMGLSDSVTFTGYIVGNEKEAFFHKASIYCMCSYEEGFPMVVLEAWAYGLCVVTTPVGGLPDVLEEGKNALVFDFGDWKGLANHLASLIENETRRRAMAEYSRRFVYHHFSIADINKELTSIYNSLA